MKVSITQKLLSILNEPYEVMGIHNLTEEQRILAETELINHFEFEKIIWMSAPSVLLEDGITLLVADETILSDSENPTYKNKVGYVYTISFTPKMYSPLDIHTPVKDGCVISPITYNPKTYEPSKSITLTWSPSITQYIDTPPLTYEQEKQMIRDMLEKVLSNPEEYLQTGFRGGLLRYAVM